MPLALRLTVIVKYRVITNDLAYMDNLRCIQTKFTFYAEYRGVA